MSVEDFWSNRDEAQKLIDESASIRRRTEPLAEASRKLEDFLVMVELAESEPEEAQTGLQKELARDIDKFARDLEAIELEVLLDGPHDRNNCIFSINAGAG